MDEELASPYWLIAQHDHILVHNITIQTVELFTWK
jgi:hypothetical protein